MMNNIALIVAAGSGERLGGALPKQYLPIRTTGNAQMPMLRASIDAFLRHPAISQVCVVIAEKDLELYQQATKGLALLPPVIGGQSRQQSVARGLEGLAKLAPSNVLIHDACRPFVSQEVITRVIAALEDSEAVDLAIPVIDTIKSTAGGLRTLDRGQLYATQTPQGFRYSTILEIHRRSQSQGRGNNTDDISLCLEAGLQVKVVDGEQENYKITSRQDYERASGSSTPGTYPRIRVGLGYDLHRFNTETQDSYIMLGGVEVPCKHSIIAHSDGDVLLHALTDAILGTIGDGDIGTHFPPSDPQWVGVASVGFLEHALQLLAAKGGRVVHVDTVIMTEFPKIVPQRERIVASLMKILALPKDSISIKAKTAEKLDAIGQGLGIAAHVVCCVEFG